MTFWSASRDRHFARIFSKIQFNNIIMPINPIFSECHVLKEQLSTNIPNENSRQNSKWLPNDQNIQISYLACFICTNIGKLWIQIRILAIKGMQLILNDIETHIFTKSTSWHQTNRDWSFLKIGTVDYWKLNLLVIFENWDCWLLKIKLAGAHVYSFINGKNE